MDKIPSWFARFFYLLLGLQYVQAARASLSFGAIGAGLQATLTITATGALLGDYCELGVETIEEAGIITVAKVTAADTVTVYCVNNTAGSITPAAKFYDVTVLRRSR